MILASSVLTAWASGDITFPAILCMLGLLAMHRRFTVDIRPERRFITALLLLLLAILFALHCRYTHVRSDEAAAFAWQTIARYFLASMILILFLRPRDRLPPSLGLFHLANGMAAGQAMLIDDLYVPFRLAELLSVMLVILYAGAEGYRSRDKRPARSRPRYAFHALRLTILVLAVNVGWVAGSVLYRHIEALNFLPQWFWRTHVSADSATVGTAHVGFSTSGKLSGVLSIMEDPDPTPVLSVIGDTNPGYLRAMAFEVYRQSGWHDLSYREALMPEQNTPLGMYLVGRTNFFRLHDWDSSADVMIRHETTIKDVMFMPLGTCTIEAPFNLLMRDDDDIVGPQNPRSNLSYRVFYASSPGGSPPTGAQMRRMQGLVHHLDPRIRQLANRVFRGCNTTSEKIDAVVRYFQTNYTYALGLDVPIGKDALTYFLLEASTGYCEYFGSGAAILLRFAGVPTRYVTGFLVTERDEAGEAWVARNMDAHAWAEAWDDQRRQWVIVEATVTDDLDRSSLSDQLAQTGVGGSAFLSRLLTDLYDYGLFGVVASLVESYSLATAVPLSMFFFGGALWVVFLRRYKRLRAEMAGAGYSEEILALRKMLATMDRKARSAGARRRPDETLHAFADRLRLHAAEASGSNPPASGLQPPALMADWYLQYAALRYCPAITPDRLANLHHLAQKLRSRS